MSSRDGQVEPLSCAELGRYRDAESALRDPQVQEQYEGQWVVAYQGQIIAHGDDPIDIELDEGEGDRLGIGIAAEPLGDRHARIDVHERAGADARLKRRRHLDLDANHAL